MKYLLLGLIALTGCAEATGNSVGGMVNNSWPDAHAMALASTHCAKYHKQPIITGAPYPAVLFQCVE